MHSTWYTSIILDTATDTEGSPAHSTPSAGQLDVVGTFIFPASQEPLIYPHWKLYFRGFLKFCRSERMKIGDATIVTLAIGFDMLWLWFF